VTSRERRLAENEALFRQYNERLVELRDELPVHGPDIVCECADEDCEVRLPVPPGVYERARSSPTRFIVTTGHERPEVERVVEHGDGWTIVEKVGEAGDVAAELS
jgi:hypothetical protein